MNGPFSDLAALEGHFRARGFVDQDGLADQATAEFYSRVLVPEDERSYLLSVHIMSGEAIGRLEAGLTAYFDPSERRAVYADLAALAGTLAASADNLDGFLLAALESGRDDESDLGGIRFQVIFPEREPDQTFLVAHVEASRPLEPGEWEGASDDEPPGAEAIAACRDILRARSHPLAERSISLTMSSDMGGERLDMLMSDDGSSLWLTTRPGKKPTLSIIGPDGTPEDL